MPETHFNVKLTVQVTSRLLNLVFHICLGKLISSATMLINGTDTVNKFTHDPHLKTTLTIGGNKV